MRLFSRKKTDETSSPSGVTIAPAEPAGKGRPTPKRKDAEASALKKTLAPPRSRADYARSKEERREARKEMLAGNEAYLPVKDRGAARRLARDVVDSRFNLGDWFIVYFIAFYILMIAFQVMKAGMLMSIVSLLLVFLCLALIVDGVLLTRRVKKVVSAKLGPEHTRGLAFYSFSRSIYPRRWRIPRPQVKHGERPE